MSSSNLGSIADQLDPDAHVAARHNSEDALGPCWACEHGDHGHCDWAHCYRCPDRHLHRRFGLSGHTSDLANPKRHKTGKARR